MNDDQRNNSLASNRATDVAVMTNTYFRDPASKETLDLINRICEGNLIYHNNLFYGDISSSNPIITGERVNTFNYDFDTEISEDSAKVQYVDMHRTSYHNGQEGIVVTDPDEHLKQLLNDADKALEEKVDNVITMLNGMTNKSDS